MPEQPAPLKRLAVLAAVVLAGCASTPPPDPGPARPAPAPRPLPPASGERDGPEANPPPDLDKVPDATPQVEPVRPGGPNKPYTVLGQNYVPERGDPPIVERGIASWYGRRFHGRSTASGEIYNMYAMTAAHKTMPIPSYARVRNPANGQEVIVRINDRGPFHPGRIIDLSYTAAMKLGLLRGVAPVEVERITHEAIRTGAWRRSADAPALAAATPVTAPAPPTPSVAELAREVAAEPAPPAAEPPAPVVAAAAAAPTSRPAATQAAAEAPVPPQRAFTPPQRGFWVQLGAFSQHEGATAFQQKVETVVAELAPLLAVFNDRQLHRLQAGPYATRDEARSVAERLRSALQLVPLVVERR